MSARRRDADRLREGLLLDELRLAVSVKEQRRRLVELYPVASDRCVPVVRGFLSSDDDGSRVTAINVLGAVGSEAAVSALAESLEWQTNLWIGATARTLRKLADRSAVPALASCLQGRRGELGTTEKLLLIAALAAAPHRTAVPALAAVLNDRSRRVRRAAARVLERLDMPESDAALRDAAHRRA